MISCVMVIGPQFPVPPVQVPDWQVSPVVQLSPSLQVVPFEASPSPGQAADDPVQVSVASH